jgi:hypothetical protein
MAFGKSLTGWGRYAGGVFRFCFLVLKLDAFYFLEFGFVLGRRPLRRSIPFQFVALPRLISLRDA